MNSNKNYRSYAREIAPQVGQTCLAQLRKFYAAQLKQQEPMHYWKGYGRAVAITRQWQPHGLFVLPQDKGKDKGDDNVKKVVVRSRI